jgi:quercetin dioxygenase-like cupin family protein
VAPASRAVDSLRMNAIPAGGHTLVNVEDPVVESFEGRFFRLRRALGTTAFGINEVRLPAGSSGKQHDERETGHEEVYVVLDGSGTFTLDGTPVAVKPGDYLRVDAEVVRTATAGPDGLRFIAVGSKALPEDDGRSVL